MLCEKLQNWTVQCDERDRQRESIDFQYQRNCHHPGGSRPQSNSEDRRPTPIEDVNTFSIDKDVHQCTQINKQKEDAMRQEVEQVIMSNTNLFAWSVSDMSGINPNFISHKLTIFSYAKHVA